MRSKAFRRVTHNGLELPGNGSVSIGPVPGAHLAYCGCPPTAAKLQGRVSGEQPGGTWVAQLIQNGQPVRPADLPLKDNDRDREMYVRYQKK